MPIEIGNQNLISRTVSLPAQQTVLIFDVNVDIQQGWQFIYQIGSTSQAGTLSLDTHTNLSDFTQRFDWGAHTGDFITGKGSFRISATNDSLIAANVSSLSGYVTTENYIDEVGSLTDAQFTTGLIGVFSDAGAFGGFVPFPYNAWSIYTHRPIDIRFVDDAGVAQATWLAVTNLDSFLFNQYIPKRLRLQVAGTVGAQPVTVQWTRR